jgi:hypothetical protein
MSKYEVSNVLAHGTTNLTTANTPKQIITRTDIEPKRGVRLKAGIANTGIVYVGDSSVGVSGASCGYPLDGGDELFLECEDPTVLFGTNNSANDTVHWIIT